MRTARTAVCTTYYYWLNRRVLEQAKMAVRLRLRSLISRADAGSAVGGDVSVAVDKKTTLSELKSLVAEQDLIKTKSAMI